MHTTNYVNTLIAVADDCPAEHGITPPAKPGSPSIASRTFQLIADNRYRSTSDYRRLALYAVDSLEHAALALDQPLQHETQGSAETLSPW